MIVIALGIALGGGLALIAGAVLPRTSASSHRRGQLRTRLEAGYRDAMTLAQMPRISPLLALILCILIAVTTGGIAFGMTGIPGLGAVSALTAGCAPASIVAGRARRNLRRSRSSWPDLLDHLAAGLRVGLPLSEAVSSLAAVAPAGLRRGVEAFDRSLRRGSGLDGALRAMRESVADPIADRVVVALLLARDLGGTELPGLLRGLAESLRQEASARGEAEARQSWVVAAARLGVVAPWLVLLLLASRTEAAAYYASPGGTVLIITGFIITVIAYRIMLRTGRLPEDRRIS